MGKAKGDSEVSLFKVGDEVEVNGENEEFKDTWFTAKIIKLTNKKSAKILIQYEISKYRKFVNQNGIRPLPPPKEANEVFECLQVVDAFYKNGWKKGRIFKVLINKNVRFTVYFPGSNERVDFGAEMLRVHYDWVDSKWRKSLHQERGIKCDQGELQQTDQPQLLHVGNTALSPDTADESHSRKRKTKNTTPSGDAQLSPPNKKLNDGEETECSLSLIENPTIAMPTRTITESATFSDVETPTRNADGALLLQKKVVNQNLADLFTSQSNGLSNQPSLKFCQEEMRSDFDCDRFGDQTNVTDSSFSFLSTIRGEPSDSSIPEALYLQENHAVLSLAHSIKSLGAIDIYQQKGSVGEPTPHILDSGCQSKQIVYEEPELHISSGEVTEFVQKMPTSEETKIIMAQTLSNFEIVKPLSMYLGGSYPLAMIDNRVSLDKQHTFWSSMENTSTEASSKGKATENGEREIAKQAFLIDQNSDNEVLENDYLPFIKTYSGWKELESMEVFRSMPQKPHFGSLQNQPELLREGQAVGLMISFAKLVEKTSKLQIDEPKCVLENILEVLPHFEACFDVGPIRALLKELLRVKDTKLQLDEKLKQIGGDIIKAKDDEEAQKSEMDKLDQKLRELQEAINEKNKERQTIVEIKQATSSIIAFLQKRHVEIEKEMQNTRLNFHNVVAAPW